MYEIIKPASAAWVEILYVPPKMHFYLSYVNSDKQK